MTVVPTTQSSPSSMRGSRPSDHRGSPIPNGAMIATRLMELRKRRGLMTALIVVFIGLPTIFLAGAMVGTVARVGPPIAPVRHHAVKGYFSRGALTSKGLAIATSFSL